MLLTIPEACAMIRVGRTKFYQLLNAGEIKAVKIGKKTLILETSIHEWIFSLPSYKIKTHC
ncbi:MAG: helix-turn-helix domain-containing protein [Alphaproteobacteria bacterium]|nr:helix-turn-helix domain-containing protein [Alphaproteobacteria bacterium]